MAEWTTVASVSDVAEGAIFGATLEGEDLLVVKVGDHYRALGATCTHAGCNLADDGDLEDGTVVCGCHGSVYDLETGEAIGPPADEGVPLFDVRVEDDQIQVAPTSA
jgi:nitrite reductase/ring-hydroxylating ferredoxin subunit